MTGEDSPTARALRVLELLQSAPGITADRLAQRLGVTDRAARRYVGILREAGIPVESVRGPYGGYRVGRGVRLPPLTFPASEALGLVMAVLDGDSGAVDPDDPVGRALSRILRVLPAPVARTAEAVWRVSAGRRESNAVRPDPDTTAAVVAACADHRRVRLAYRTGRDSVMDVDPWAVVLRRGKWYLLCWSHSRDARRVLRLDRIVSVEPLPETYEPPADLDPVGALEEHLGQGWRYAAEVVVDAPPERVVRWIPRSLGRCVPADGDRTRLVGSTDEPEWYAAQLVGLRTSYRIVGSAELRAAAADLGRRYLTASSFDI
ncbi:helix-turn-helix transcriptional regulator [Actinocatenispora rupis]|uniref:Transcriptional regulator n=1 Tax=Actinocatenispora rupis TaxID=519421 RepID=A0A8J3J195_9ACTN|nr:WYL domain-containing protein [Actinocatenispora rupis]GID12705.1 transcriptional regulator [Actinocatenispora rupis]